MASAIQQILGFAHTKTKTEACTTEKSLASSALCSLLWGWESLRGKGMSSSLQLNALPAAL